MQQRALAPDRQRAAERPAGRGVNMWLSAHIAAMATLATWMLGMGENRIALPLITTLAAALSLILTDWFGWFRLHRILANLAMVAAAFLSLHSFLELGSHDQLIAIADLLVYVQMILLFQQKNLRIYGQLAVFSLLQVVVACLLNNSLEFGILLMVYLFVAVLGLVLFFVDREVGSLGTVARPRFPWPWLPQNPLSNASSRGAVQVWLELPPATFFRTVISRRLFAPLLAMLSASLVFVVLFFYTAPRSQGPAWSSQSRTYARIGFSPEVSLREMGRVLVSNERVMRVAFTNATTGEPYTVIGQPYFRGAVLNTYDPSNGEGKWFREFERATANYVRLPPPAEGDELVVQDTLLEPTRRARLFSVVPAFAGETTDPDIYMHHESRAMFRQEATRPQLSREYRFQVLTNAFKFGAQSQLMPDPEKTADAESRDRRRRRFNRMLLHRAYLHHDGMFPGLIALAERIVREGAPDGNAYDKAKALERHFQEDESYTYSLDFGEIGAKRRPSVDPIEDFVTNHRTGHCEYFASALVMMLRGQGIPARMVIGYHGGEYNYVGNYFDVRQRHAHAWVEAHLRADEIPANMRDPAHAGTGGWLRLDPTPLDDEESGSQITVIDHITKSFDYARWLWNEYILRLNKERQQETVFGALAEERTIPLERVVDTQYWMNLMKQAVQWEFRTLMRQPISWRGGIAAAVLCLLGYGIYRVVPRIWHLLRLIPTLGRARAPSRQRPVTFYRKLEAALARIGLHRQASQTPRELAEQAAQLMIAAPHLQPVSNVPGAVVDAFYRVRFGRWQPDPHALAEIQQQLKQLEAAIAAGKGRTN